MVPKPDTLLCTTAHEIMSINTTYRIRDEGQPWWGPTCTENKIDFVARI